MKQLTTTLVFLTRPGEILLAMKKRGHGAGLWNGVGGKVEPGETTEQALVRECQEEIGVTPSSYRRVVEHHFVMGEGHPDEWHMHCHTYLCDAWEGEPTESEEMAPQWYKLTEIPYDGMWQDDRYWLPLVLAGKKLKTTFRFDENERMLDQKITEAEEL